MAQTHSKACCTIPPIVSKDYEPKGKYEEINGMKTYTTGPASATKGLLVVFDIFGFYPQTLQGADILANSDKEHPLRVFIPDFFDGKPADMSWYPPNTKEKEGKLGEFFKTTAAPPTAVVKVPKIMAELKKVSPEVTSWGIVGYCWGGKVASIVSQETTTFSAAAMVHPAMVDPTEAAGIQIPFCLLASKDEDKDKVAKYAEALTKQKYVETFGDQIHGWMGARADLDDPNVRKEYERGYEILLDFYHKYL